MDAPKFSVRRATVDDLPQLAPLLNATLLPGPELEKRFTEFQVVERDGGVLVGALGLQVAGKHGNIHSESYSDFSLADMLRPMLWERIQKVAQNYGLVRLWTLETAPFWKQAGFATPDEAAQKVFPTTVGKLDAPWLTLKLKEDIENVLSLDKEFAMFMESEKARTEGMYSQAKLLKTVAYILAIVLVLFVLGASFYLFKGIRNNSTPSFRQTR